MSDNLLLESGDALRLEDGGLLLFELQPGGFTLIANTGAGSPDQNGVTSPSIDTTGADLLVVSAAYYSLAAAPTLSDSKGNTWIGLTESADDDSNKARLFYCVAPIVGAGHTFTLTGSASASTICVSAYSGALQALPVDQQNTAITTAGTSLATGSVTPSQDNELLVYAFSSNLNVSVSVSVGSILNQVPAGVGQHFAGGMARQIQTAATARNPSFSWSGTFNMAAVIATFKAAAAGVTLPRLERGIRGLHRGVHRGAFH